MRWSCEANPIKFCKSISDISDPLDVVVIATPAPTVPKILEEAGLKGVKAAIIISSGFAEAGNTELEKLGEDSGEAIRHKSPGP